MDRVVCGSTAFGWVIYMGVIVPRYTEILFGDGTAASTPNSTLVAIAIARVVALCVYIVGIAANLKAHALSAKLALRQAITGSKHRRFRDVVRSLMGGKARLRRDNAALRRKNAELAAANRELRRRLRRRSAVSAWNRSRFRDTAHGGGTFEDPPPGPFAPLVVLPPYTQQHGETGLRRSPPRKGPRTPRRSTMAKYLEKQCGLDKEAASKVSEKYAKMFSQKENAEQQ